MSLSTSYILSFLVPVYVINLVLLEGANFVGANDVALSEVRTEKPLPQNGSNAESEEPTPAQEEDRPRTEKSVLQGKLTKLAIQIGYGGQ